MELFTVEKSTEFGRYSVATTDIEAGVLLLKEYPFVFGPKLGSKCVCLECYSFVDGTVGGSRCQNCSWPICADCTKLNDFQTHNIECEIFKQNKCKFYNLLDSNSVCIQLDCITPLRTLMSKETYPERWIKELEPMEDHKKDRQGTESWTADSHNIVTYLLGPCKLKDRGIDENLVQQVIGILEINAFEAKTSEGHAIGCLFPKHAISTHSCTPNTAHAIHPTKGYKMESRSTVPIKKGEQHYTTYTYTLNGTAERQKHLRAGKFFICRCQRCLDPTELGTHFSSLKCQDCESGNVIPLEPLDLTADWHCDGCYNEIKVSHVVKTIKAIKNEIKTIQLAKLTMVEKIELMEKQLLKNDEILHSNHFINLSIKYVLVELIGYLFEPFKMERRIKLCRDILKILDVFEQGKTRARGLILFELQASIIISTRFLLDSDMMSKEMYKKNTKEALEILEESADILGWEDSNCTFIPETRNSLSQMKLYYETL